MSNDGWIEGDNYIKKPRMHIPEEELTVGISELFGEKIFVCAYSDKESVSLRHLTPTAARSFAGALLRIADRFEGQYK